MSRRPTPSTEVELFSLAGHDGILREVNGAFARLLGLETEEINGRSLLELVHPDDIPTIVAGLSELEGGAAEALFECRFMGGVGRPVHLQRVARPMPESDLWWAAGRDTSEFHQLLAEQVDLRARLDGALPRDPSLPGTRAHLYEPGFLTGLVCRIAVRSGLGVEFGWQRFEAV